jgi:membrane protein CcdC involved in cytochrome C biogenesis
MKKTLGWILFLTGTFMTVVISRQYWQEVLTILPTLIIGIVIPILFIWGGWKLAHRAE